MSFPSVSPSSSRSDYQHKMMTPMHPPSSPTPNRRRPAAASRRVPSSSKPKSPPKVAPSPSAPKPVTAQSLLYKLNESLVASAIAAENDNDVEEAERPSTPDRAVTPPPPSTPIRVEDLEAELFDFSPFKSFAADGNNLFGLSTSPTLHSAMSPSVFTSRAPLLRMSKLDELLAGNGDPASILENAMRSPAAPAPRTPKRSPFLCGVGAGTSSFRIASPFGTPSRNSMRDAFHPSDDDWLQLYQSSNDLFAAYTTIANSPTPSNREC